MRVQDHVKLSATAATLALPWLKKDVWIPLAASIFIDVDHYLWHAVTQRTLSLSAAVRFFGQADPPQTMGAKFFHHPLMLGLLLFLGVHSTRIFANDWRTSMIQRIGPLSWKGLYAVLSIVGFVVIVIGFKQAPMSSYLIFPRALQVDKEQSVIGINYLLIDEDVPSAPLPAQKSPPRRTRKPHAVRRQ